MGTRLLLRERLSRWWLGARGTASRAVLLPTPRVTVKGFDCGRGQCQLQSVRRVDCIHARRRLPFFYGYRHEVLGIGNGLLRKEQQSNELATRYESRFELD